MPRDSHAPLPLATGQPHALLPRRTYLLGTKLDTRSSRLSAQSAPTRGSSADVGNKTTCSCASVFRVLPRPREFINQTPDTLSIVSTHDA